MAGLREQANSLIVFPSGLGASVTYTLETYSGVAQGEQKLVVSIQSQAYQISRACDW